MDTAVNFGPCAQLTNFCHEKHTVICFVCEVLPLVLAVDDSVSNALPPTHAANHFFQSTNRTQSAQFQ